MGSQQVGIGHGQGGVQPGLFCVGERALEKVPVPREGQNRQSAPLGAAARARQPLQPQALTQDGKHRIGQCGPLAGAQRPVLAEVAGNHRIGGVFELEDLLNQGRGLVYQGFGVHTVLSPPCAASRLPPQGDDASGLAKPVPRHPWNATSRSGRCLGIPPLRVAQDNRRLCPIFPPR